MSSFRIRGRACAAADLAVCARGYWEKRIGFLLAGAKAPAFFCCRECLREIATAQAPRNDMEGEFVHSRQCLHAARRVVAPYGFYWECLHTAGRKAAVSRFLCSAGRRGTARPASGRTPLPQTTRIHRDQKALRSAASGSYRPARPTSLRDGMQSARHGSAR